MFTLYHAALLNEKGMMCCKKPKQSFLYISYFCRQEYTRRINYARVLFIPLMLNRLRYGLEIAIPMSVFWSIRGLKTAAV